MSESDPGYTGQQNAGDVGAHRATVGTPTERESINVPPTRPGAAENARQAETAREEHETFIPESPVADERSEATENLRTEEESLKGESGEDDEEEDDVRKDIQKSRRDLGETVSELAGKADVKSRASHAAQAARGTAGHAAELAKGKAGHAAELAKGKAGHAAETAKGRAAGAAATVKGKASEVAGKVRESAPDQAKDVATQARKRPVLLVAAIGAVLGFMVRRMMTKRRTQNQATRPRWFRKA
ncbi:DUF3618 domain-containing protein [Nonomuraea diastatica]|uniref:DUF3618 domain-containing protein n=1 Tax=Nonomuraea diastatica TaxID=1848329 RepID=A0A4R4WC79_9ACTN|nr:DUF3618 domain-containing protein [Nonomuraea diastatica]TDD15791.1 DUF3618 domain-containing protein [Nonomuraea diastatica]